MIYSSNFASLTKIHSPLHSVSIARGTPKWYKGRCYPDLMPDWEWLKATREEYDREFQKRLESLDPKRVIRELGENAVLLCWCKHNAGCHRRLVAEWLEERLGIVISELGYSREDCRSYVDCYWDLGPVARKRDSRTVQGTLF